MKTAVPRALALLLGDSQDIVAEEEVVEGMEEKSKGGQSRADGSSSSSGGSSGGGANRVQHVSWKTLCKKRLADMLHKSFVLRFTRTVRCV